jgi:N-acetyl-anhydromuramyl-L-alanine amidase AmpD
LFNTVNPRIFILKGAVNIKQDVSLKTNWIGNVPLKDKPTSPIVIFLWHLEDNKTYDFLQDDLQKVSRHCIIDQDNKLIVYGNLKGLSTLYFNNLISI